VYTAVFERLHGHKIGMSAWMHLRIKELDKKHGALYAALVLTVEEIGVLLEEEIDAIMALKLPGIRPSERNLVARQNTVQSTVITHAGPSHFPVRL